MYFTSEGNTGQLYGTIWSGDGQWIAHELQAFLKGKSEATIHLHTPGGSVFDGNLIYNVLKASKAKINIVIDGLAASMGSILMLAGTTVTMAENSFVMIHAPSGVVDGSASDMKNAATLLASLENQFLKKYVAKTGKTEQEVKQWLNGDNWFSADDAVLAGLVDGITEPVLDGVDLSAVLKMDTKALCDNFDKQFLNQVNNKNNETMKLNAQSKAVLGVSDDATDEQVNAAIEALSKDNQTMKARAEQDKQARIRTLIDTAVADGRIAAKDKQEWEDFANANLSLAETSIARLTVKENMPVVTGRNTPAPNADERKDWTFTDWTRKDTQGLLKMKSENPEAYRALADKSGVKL